MSLLKEFSQGHAKNLGQIAAISFGATPPENTKLLWFDRTGQGYLKYYDSITGKWEPINSRSSVVGIEKVYKSIAEMVADKNPYSDITGQPLIGGQLAVIVPEDPKSLDKGRVYRWDDPGWTYIFILGQQTFPIVQTPGDIIDVVMSQKAVTDFTDNNITVGQLAGVGAIKIDLIEGQNWRVVFPKSELKFYRTRGIGEGKEIGVSDQFAEIVDEKERTFTFDSLQQLILDTTTWRFRLMGYDDILAEHEVVALGAREHRKEICPSGILVPILFYNNIHGILELIAQINTKDTAQDRGIKTLNEEIQQNTKDIANKQNTVDAVGRKITPGGEIFNDYNNNVASGRFSHAGGAIAEASGNYSFAIGNESTASGDFSHAEGDNTYASGDFSFTEGENTSADNYAQHVMGVANIEDPNPKPNTYDATKPAFVIGNGTFRNPGDAFRVMFNGDVFADGTYKSPAGDYAEMFEWKDGNPQKEDRVGLIVALDGDRIVKANGSFHIGIVSANPSILGDNPMRWAKKYATDEWGRTIFEEKEVTYTKKECIPVEELEAMRKKAKEGEVVPVIREVKKTRVDYVPKLNPDYNPSLNFVPRTDRSEWSAVGMIGKLLVRQDGTLVAGGRCSAMNGIATNDDSGTIHVMKVINEKQALVLVR